MSDERIEIYLLSIPSDANNVDAIPAISQIMPDAWFASDMKRREAAVLIFNNFNANGWAYLGSVDTRREAVAVKSKAEAEGYVVELDVPEENLPVRPKLDIVPDPGPDASVSRTAAALSHIAGGNALLATQHAAILRTATGDIRFWTDVQTELRLLFPWVADLMLTNNIPYDGGAA